MWIPLASSLLHMSRHFAKSICLFFLLRACLSGFSQPCFDHITSLNGLSQGSVFSIFQDSKGYMWFGSMDGLNLFDGYGFTVYRNEPGNERSLSRNEIKCIAEDSKGRLLVGVITGGLNIREFEGDIFTRITRDVDGNAIDQLAINTFANDNQGRTWVGSERGIYLLLPGNKMQLIPSTATQHITALLKDKQSRIWAGTRNGEIWCFDQTSGKPVKYPIQFPNPQPHLLRTGFFIDHPSLGLLVGFEGNGLFRFDDKTATFQSVLFYENRDGRNVMRGVTTGADRKLKIACDAGFLTLEATLPIQVTHTRPSPENPCGLKSHALQAIYEDNFHNLWIGYWEDGIDLLYGRANPFQLLSNSDGLRTNKSTGVAQSGKDLLISSGKGIAVLGPNGLKPPLLEGKEIIFMVSHSPEAVYAYSWKEGLYGLFEGKKPQLFYPRGLPDASHSFTLGASALQGKDTVWMGSYTGILWRLIPSTGDIQEITRLPVESTITAMTVDPAGKVWIGTFATGIWCYDPGRSLMERVSTSLKNEPLRDGVHINHFFQDRKGDLWVGTNGFGLLKYNWRDKLLVDQITRRDGLTNDVIKSIQDDAEGIFWLSTNEGISRFDPESRQVRNYRSSDGLYGKEFVFRACFRDSLGKIYFGGVHGVNIFHPDSVYSDDKMPVVHFSGLRLLNRAVTPGAANSPLKTSLDNTANLTLTYAQAASITFEYVGIYFRRDNSCTYAFKLDGFDQWNEVGTQRNATYTNLNPGHYTFRVKAANPDGTWSINEKTLSFTILPPWYLSGWAIAVYLLLLALALYAYRYYVRKQENLKSKLALQEIETRHVKQLDELKTRFFTNISHELRTPLTLILDPTEQILENPDLPQRKVLAFNQVIHQNAVRLLQLINQLLDLSRIETQAFRLSITRGELVQFIRRVMYSFSLAAEKQGVVLDFSTNTDEARVYFSPDALEKIISNLIANALKATPSGGQIHLHLTMDMPAEGEEHSSFQLDISDTGKGISQEDLPHIFQRYFQTRDKKIKSGGTGIGLALTYELVKKHQGNIAVNSIPGEGTTFGIALSVAKNSFPESWIQEENVHQETYRRVPEEPIPAASLTDMSNPEKKRVLVVEDNAAMRAYLLENLGQEYAISTSEDAEQGWEMVLNHPPELVISDLVLPGMDGNAFCRQLKSNEKTSHIPVILLTSQGLVSSHLEGLDSGADDYLTKPFHLHVLQARVRNLLFQRVHLQKIFANQTTFQPGGPPITATDEQFLRKAIDLIHSRMEDPNFSIEHLEKALLMSKMQLYRKLTALVDMSGNNFIRYVRLQRAKQLLAESNLTVSEIAYQVGYKDPSYFTKVYKKTFGQLPRESQPASTEKPLDIHFQQKS